MWARPQAGARGLIQSNTYINRSTVVNCFWARLELAFTYVRQGMPCTMFRKKQAFLFIRHFLFCFTFFLCSETHTFSHS